GDYVIETEKYNVPCPPCNVGVRSTPNYGALAMQAVATLDTGEHVFAGQRSDGFYVDLGAIFDLGTLRPFQHLHLIPSADAAGINSLRDFNVHTIAVQVPMSVLTRDRKNPTDPMKPASVIGVWANAARQKGTIRMDNGDVQNSGPFMQVSRLGNPLFNEVIVPMSEKDEWNALQPDADSRFAKYVAHPELAKLLPVLYPGVFPHLAAYKKSRADLLAILLTGIPGGIIPGFQNFTGTTQADMLRLNMAIKPTSKPNDFGILGGDLAGFPNGRRINDDIVSIELRAVAGATIPLVDPSYKPDAAAAALTEGLSSKSVRPTLPNFPYLGEPVAGTSTAVA
ncbi:MAG: DUF4331 domain-containing protein, partial [Acidimicrobiia bacterium]|nr:DUF4331 domain-containing protein [Acidimicrobiia bacterium]